MAKGRKRLDPSEKKQSIRIFIKGKHIEKKGGVSEFQKYAQELVENDLNKEK